MNAPKGPVITGVHHVCLTVTDIDASMNWYQQLFQAGRWPGRLPHYAREETGFAEMLVEPHTGVLVLPLDPPAGQTPCQWRQGVLPAGRALVVAPAGVRAARSALTCQRRAAAAWS